MPSNRHSRPTGTAVSSASPRGEQYTLRYLSAVKATNKAVAERKLLLILLLLQHVWPSRNKDQVHTPQHDHSLDARVVAVRAAVCM